MVNFIYLNALWRHLKYNFNMFWCSLKVNRWGFFFLSFPKQETATGEVGRFHRWTESLIQANKIKSPVFRDCWYFLFNRFIYTHTEYFFTSGKQLDSLKLDQTGGTSQWKLLCSNRTFTDSGCVSLIWKLDRVGFVLNTNQNLNPSAFQNSQRK